MAWKAADCGDARMVARGRGGADGEDDVGLRRGGGARGTERAAGAASPTFERHGDLCGDQTIGEGRKWRGQIVGEGLSARTLNG